MSDNWYINILKFLNPSYPRSKDPGPRPTRPHNMTADPQPATVATPPQWSVTAVARITIGDKVVARRAVLGTESEHLSDAALEKKYGRMFKAWMTAHTRAVQMQKWDVDYSIRGALIRTADISFVLYSLITKLEVES